MRIGTERSPEGQDTIRILETTETPNDMIVEWEWEWRYEGDDIRTIIFELQASVSIPIPFSFCISEANRRCMFDLRYCTS